jgi:hypothetical protein
LSSGPRTTPAVVAPGAGAPPTPPPWISVGAVGRFWGVVVVEEDVPEAELLPDEAAVGVRV